MIAIDGILLQGDALKEVWVKASGLLLPLWSRDIIVKMGNCLDSFIDADDSKRSASYL